MFTHVIRMPQMSVEGNSPIHILLQFFIPPPYFPFLVLLVLEDEKGLCAGLTAVCRRELPTTWCWLSTPYRTGTALIPTYSSRRPASPRPQTSPQSQSQSQTQTLPLILTLTPAQLTITSSSKLWDHLIYGLNKSYVHTLLTYTGSPLQYKYIFQTT